jgi:hypothetical protein
VEVKDPSPEHTAFIVTGSMEWRSGEPLAIFRIPFKGTNWHKKILPAILKVVRDNGNPRYRKNDIIISGDDAGNLWEKHRRIQHYDWVEGQFKGVV